MVAPDEKIHGMQTTFGVLQLRLNNTAKTLTLNATTDMQYFPNSRRDSFCLQMGFTKAADTVYTVQALQPKYDENGLRISGFNFKYR